MKQSKRVNGASWRALARLSGMSKEELDQRLAARELCPVGQFLLATGSMEVILHDKESQWVLEKGVVSLQIGKKGSATQLILCADVMYEFAHLSSWAKVSCSFWDVIEPMVKQWSRAA